MTIAKRSETRNYVPLNIKHTTLLLMKPGLNTIFRRKQAPKQKRMKKKDFVKLKNVSSNQDNQGKKVA